MLSPRRQVIEKAHNIIIIPRCSTISVATQLLLSIPVAYHVFLCVCVSNALPYGTLGYSICKYVRTPSQVLTIIHAAQLNVHMYILYLSI